MTYAFQQTWTLGSGTGANSSFYYPMQLDVPLLRGDAPAEWSTSTEVDLSPRFINDGNHYYKTLGFRWPYLGLTKGDLMRAYRDRNGAADSYATYAFKQLLNPEVRRHYDRMLFGHQFPDRYVYELLLRKAKLEAGKRAATGNDVEPIDVLAEWGFDRSMFEPSADSDGSLTDDEGFPSEDTESDEEPDRFRWGYYTWRSSCDDEDRLLRWQRLLLTAAREQGLRARLAVGFTGPSFGTPASVVVLGATPVVFLSEFVSPTPELAAVAVGRVIEMINL